MMETAKYSISIPSLNDFELNYYFSNDNKIKEVSFYPPHIHDVVEIYILLEGNASFMVENKVYSLNPYDMIITRPNEIHNCILKQNSVHNHICIWFDNNSSKIFSKKFNIKSLVNNLVTFNNEDKEIVKTILEDFSQASLINEKLLILSKFYELIYYIQNNIKIDDDDYDKKEIPDLLQNILDYINNEFMNINSIDEVADKFYISRSTMFRMFKNYMNITPKIYLESKKLSYSRILLKQGKSVQEAAYTAGFKDYSNYIRTFKKRFKITPNSYKNLSVSDLLNNDIVKTM